ncbi:peptidyl-tRNA hydrolase 2, mitochondrial-like [Zophobas morio]|uniref:peptidyl-tRNA hydrolase 2, mitochondrial-like n=1 Tax=Zophobas morio TaxID=2755281 RepID=UPI00308298F3
MKLSVNCEYLCTFVIGTLIGATATYVFVKGRKKTPLKKLKDPPNIIEACFESKNQSIDGGYQLVIAVRTDIKMQKGKVAAQCGHASVAAYTIASANIPNRLMKWLMCGGPLITVCVGSEEELLNLKKKAKAINVISCVIRDAGHTQVAPGTRTVIAIGPGRKNLLDQITENLKLY